MMTEASLKVMGHSSRHGSAQYATCVDFSRIFAEDMKNLYLLALVLTADSEKAEQCFVSGLDDCISGNQVFREWARSWARRVVIKNAIRMIAPGRERASQVLYPAATKAAQVSNGSHAQRIPVEISSIFELPPLERFAFVMSVLEGYSDLDSALLLRCTRESLNRARLRALERISDLKIHKGLQGNTTFREDRASIEEKLDLRVRLATPA
jgi:DNA-directed RNA polymerase specialized sigma24 family protein